MPQTPRPPDLQAQLTAMKKLDFLLGEWSGQASRLRAPGKFEDLIQTESAHFKLDGLLLIIEGIGRNKTDGMLSIQALGLISFDDETSTYQMRAFNYGRWLETEVKLSGNNSLSWGFTLGQFKTSTLLRIDEDGDWTEHGEIVIGDLPPQKMLDLKVRRISQ